MKRINLYSKDNQHVGQFTVRLASYPKVVQLGPRFFAHKRGSRFEEVALMVLMMREG